MARTLDPADLEEVRSLADKARRAIEINLIRYNTGRAASDGRLSLEAFDEGGGRHRLLVARDSPGRRDSRIVFELALDAVKRALNVTSPARKRAAPLSEFEDQLTLLCKWIRDFRCAAERPRERGVHGDDHGSGIRLG
jgi:hypothetical protein